MNKQAILLKKEKDPLYKIENNFLPKIDGYCKYCKYFVREKRQCSNLHGFYSDGIKPPTPKVVMQFDYCSYFVDIDTED